MSGILDDCHAVSIERTPQGITARIDNWKRNLQGRQTRTQTEMRLTAYEIIAR